MINYQMMKRLGVTIVFIIALTTFPREILGSQIDSIKVGVLSTSGWDGTTAEGGAEFLFWWSCNVKNHSAGEAKISITVYLKNRHGDTLAWINSRSLRINGRHQNDFYGRAWIPADIRWSITEVSFRIFGDIYGAIGRPLKNDRLYLYDEKSDKK